MAGLPGGIRLGLYGARQRYPAAGVDEIEFVAILAPIALDGVRQWIRATVRVH